MSGVSTGRNVNVGVTDEKKIPRASGAEVGGD